MPNAKDNAKMSGDTHLPDVESELPLEGGSTGALGADGTPSGRGGRDGLPGRGVKKAGMLRDDEGDGEDTGGGTAAGGSRPAQSAGDSNDGSGPERSGPSNR